MPVLGSIGAAGLDTELVLDPSGSAGLDTGLGAELVLEPSGAARLDTELVLMQGWMQSWYWIAAWLELVLDGSFFSLVVSVSQCSPITWLVLL